MADYINRLKWTWTPNRDSCRSIFCQSLIFHVIHYLFSCKFAKYSNVGAASAASVCSRLPQSLGPKSKITGILLIWFQESKVKFKKRQICMMYFEIYMSDFRVNDIHIFCNAVMVICRYNIFNLHTLALFIIHVYRICARI